MSMTTTAEPTESGTGDVGVAFGLTLFAGMAVFIGALPILCLKNKQSQFMKSVIPISLGFSAGVTIHLSFVNLLSHSVENFVAVLAGDEEIDLHDHRRLAGDHDHDHDHDHGHDSDHKELSAAEISGLSHLYCVLCILLGIILMVTFEKLAHKYGGHSHEEENLSKEMEMKQTSPGDTKDTADGDNAENSDNSDNSGDQQNNVVINTNTESDEANAEYSDNDIKQTAYKMAVALILHHFPEGLATVIALYYEFELGILVALGLSLHDVPAGISIACTVYCTTRSYMKVFIVCLIAFLAYPLGALVGIAIIESGGDSELLNAILFGMICGILIYISLIEIIPTMIDISNNNKKIRMLTLIAVFVGLLFMEVSVIILSFIDFHAH